MRIILVLLLFITACESKKDTPKLTRPDLPLTTTVGIDLLGAQHPSYRLGEALEEIGEGERLPIGMLDYTFGIDMAPVNLILDSGKVNHFRVHFINGPCIRNKNCAPYDYGYQKDINSFNRAVEQRHEDILTSFRARVKLYCDLVEKHKDTTRFYFSWVLEHNLTQNAWRILDEEARKVCSRNDFYTVNNPVGNHSFPQSPRSGVLYESHHDNPRGGSALNSLDGKAGRYVDANKWADNMHNAGVKLGFSWDWVHNCRPDSGFTPPRDRTKCPSKEEHRRYINLARAAQARIDSKGGVVTAPPKNGGATVLKESFRDGGGGNLWKPVAEHENTLVVLTASRHPELNCKVKRTNGEWETLNCKKGAWNNNDCCTNSNGNRCTYRGTRKCSDYAEPKVVCSASNYQLEISASGGACSRHD